jgi:hypothetical protein
VQRRGRDEHAEGRERDPDCVDGGAEERDRDERAADAEHDEGEGDEPRADGEDGDGVAAVVDEHAGDGAELEREIVEPGAEGVDGEDVRDFQAMDGGEERAEREGVDGERREGKRDEAGELGGRGVAEPFELVTVLGSQGFTHAPREHGETGGESRELQDDGERAATVR